MASELSRIIELVWKEKGIEKEVLIDALKSALVSAAKKKLGAYKNIEAVYNEETGEIDVFEMKTVVENVENPELQISLEEARKLDPNAGIGDSIGVLLDSSIFGRMSAQTAKQIIMQKLREAEKDVIFNEFKDQSGRIVTGKVKRFENGTIVVDLGKVEAYLPPREQIPREVFRVHDNIRAYMLEIERTGRGPQIILSRASPQFIVKLFASEVPEIKEGVVEIKGVAREAGVRSKIAVYSKDPDVDPVGACVGFKGSRVQSIVQELRGEKIDIIEWSPDPARFVMHALSPATVSEVIIDPDEKMLEVIVPDDQLSLAIGRKGQNVRLASQLLDWKIDIKSESKIQEIKNTAKKIFEKITALGEKTSEMVYKRGFKSVKDLAEADIEALLKVPGMDRKTAEEIKAQAKALIDSGEVSDLTEGNTGTEVVQENK